jgi:hypothetical protein
MTKSITGARSAALWRAHALASLVLVLLSASCEKKEVAPVMHPDRRAGYVAGLSSSLDGGGGGGGEAQKTLAYSVSSALAASGQSDTLANRKLVRNGSLDLLVNDVRQSASKIGSIVTGVGGFVEKSSQTNSGGHTATITVRVPATHLDQVIVDIKRLAATVDRESVEVRDVTREYIDLDAHLRNAQAEESQYLQILKRAATIKDTLDVTEKLTDVRGRIDQLQGEMKFLTAQIDMSSLEISLRSEADATVAGFHWRPLRQAKIAAGDMVSGMADWVDSVIAFLINLPLIGVWLISIVVLVLVVVRILRFLWRKFGPKKPWRLPWRRSTPPETPGAH